MTHDAFCADYHDLLLLYAHDRLTGEQAIAVERHLAQCHHCQQEVSQWQAIGEMMRALDPQPAVPFADSWAQIQAGLTLQPVVAMTGNQHPEPDADAQSGLLFYSDVPRDVVQPVTTPITRMRALVSVALLIILFAGTFLWAHRGGDNAAGRPTPPSSIPTVDAMTDLPVTPLSSPTGFTLHLHDVYADTTRTLIHYHIDSSLYPLDKQMGDAAADLVNPTLVGADGQTFVSINGSSGGSFQRGVYVNFTPLPIAALPHEQTMTLEAEGIEYISQTHSFKAPFTTLSGPFKWQITVTPHPGHTYTLHNATQISNGVSVQVQQLDVMPANAAAPDGFPGGIRAILTFSGLPPNTILRDSFTFATAVPLPLHAGVGESSGGGAAVMALGNAPTNTSGRLAFLAGAGNGLNLDAAPTTVGPSGTLQVEAIFMLNLPAITTQVVLDITDVHLVLTMPQPDKSYGTSRQKIALNWHFQLALNG